MDEQNFKKQADCYTYIEGRGFTQPDPYIQQRHALKSYGRGIGWALLASMILYATLPYYFISFSRIFDPTVRFYNNQVIINKTIFYLMGMISYLLAFVLPFLIFIMLYKIPFKTVVPNAKVKPVHMMVAVGLGLEVTVAGGVLSKLFSAAVGLAGIAPVMPDFTLPKNDIPSAMVLLVQVILAAPLVEELVFRGVILNSLRRFGDGFAIITSAILFGLIHQNMVQLPNAFLCGLVLGYAVVRTGSVWVGVVMHICNNVMAMGITCFSQVEGGEAVARLMMACMVLAGIAALMGLLGSNQPLWAKSSVIYCGREKEKYQMFFGQPSQIICLVAMVITILHNFKRII